MDIKHKGVRSIQRVRVYGQFRYEIVLNPSYSFRSTGRQMQYCSNKSEIKEALDDIVYFDGKEDE